LAGATTIAAIGALLMGKQAIDHETKNADKKMNMQIDAANAEQDKNEQQIAEQEKKTKAAKGLNEERMRQRAMRAKYAGRSSTILSSPLGGSTADPNTSGTKTLLGS
jgi:hypothetical protein